MQTLQMEMAELHRELLKPTGAAQEHPVFDITEVTAL